MMTLLWLHRYSGDFEEAGLTKDFEKLMGILRDVVENLEARDLDKMMWVLEAYTFLEDICRRMRKSVPPTILNNLRADITDIIEATSITPNNPHYFPTGGPSAGEITVSGGRVFLLSGMGLRG